ncbi:PucR family transcriptional regulator ligand-binding domain-containing protein [Oscillospiraceae bacterium MB08-C2-2]|nr:PucR family transcriptional regulator ligand-binding domain-containing protein [Oscillospiraceae bacterium MB08-C2-2]
MPTDIQWLLHHSGLKNLTLMTCPDCVDTPIGSVNIMDNPEVIQWMKPNELVLTTGYVFADNQSLQADTLRDLKAVNCAALCIKTKRFLEVVPENMLRLSEELGLPIIELPLNYSFSDVSKLVNDQLYQEQFQDIFKEQVFYNCLFSACFEKKHTREILDIFSDYLGKSVFLMNEQYQCEWFSLLEQDFSLFEQSETLEISCDALPSRPGTASDLESYPTFPFKLNDIVRSAVVLPFPDNRYSLCILADENDPLPMDTLRHALKIITFSSVSLPKSSGDFHRYYDPFFQFLLNGSNDNELEDTLLCNHYGFSYTKPRICLLLSPRSAGAGSISQKTVVSVTSALKSAACKSDSYFIAWNQNCICIYLFGAKETLGTFALQTADALLKETAGLFYIGISRTGQKLQEIPASYREASFMLLLSAKLPNTTVLYFGDYLIFWLLYQLPKEEQQRIYEDTVKPIADYDQAANSQLMLTLQTYFECNYNSTLTANKLYIHRNTFLKRMAKIKELICVSLEDAHNLASIYSGLCIYIMNQ